MLTETVAALIGAAKAGEPDKAPLAAKKERAAVMRKRRDLETKKKIG
ncbi:MAG: hypothetical protein ACYSYV_11310 [Planctomycetota bacterium]|jgi:hypothetical protein